MGLRRTKKTEHSNWHPDFRDPSALPDIKVIRTDFLLNLVTVSIAVGLLGLLTYRESSSIDLRESIELVSANIASNKEVDQKNVRMSNEFAAVQAAMDEVVRFDNVPVTPDRLLVEIAQMIPEPVVLGSINFSGNQATKGKTKITKYSVVLSGVVSPTSESPAPSTIGDFRTALENLPSLKPYFQESELSGFTRDDKLGTYNFTIRLTLDSNPAGASI